MHRGAVEKQAWSAGPPPERGQAGRHLERTRNSPGKGLNEMVLVPEGGGEGQLGCNRHTETGNLSFKNQSGIKIHIKN